MKTGRSMESLDRRIEDAMNALDAFAEADRRRLSANSTSTTLANVGLTLFGIHVEDHDDPAPVLLAVERLAQLIGPAEAKRQLAEVNRCRWLVGVRWVNVPSGHPLS